MFFIQCINIANIGIYNLFAVSRELESWAVMGVINSRPYLRTQ